MLHAHPDPATTLVPLLRSHLPRSLPALGCIAFHLSLPSPPSSPFAFASFSPAAPPSEDEPWAVLVHQRPPSTNQLRVYSSVEREGVQFSEEQLAAAERQLRACLRAYGAAGGDEVWLGALNELWIDRFGLSKDHIYGVWLSPVVAEGQEEDLPLVVPEGLVLRKAEEQDVQTIVDTSEVRRPPEYIAALIPFSSILASSDNVAQAWILSHSDYSVGALFTQSAYRRKGLAHVVVQDRLRDMRKAGVRAWCCVADTNGPSQAFWRNGFGWARGWGSGWFHVPLESL